MDNKNLCMQLLKSETETEVIELLQKHGYWDNPDVWRWYGDKENNYKDAGNQAAEAEAALVEKITNARDARLMNECLLKFNKIESPDVPKSLEEAVGTFFGDSTDKKAYGLIKDWTTTKRTEIARGITLSLTGNKPADGFPCVVIADCGEGQTPYQIPRTILSLGESIKMRIPFVHGKFNMGGTAVLRFCGYHNLQLVISRRNQLLPKKEDESHHNDDEWGFTIVRRNYPKGNFDSKLSSDDKTRSSVYCFLAPINAESIPTKGEILSFKSQSFPLFPKGNNSYAINAEWGTLLKMYEFKTKKRSHMFMRDGLLESLDILLPKPGLPVRLHECRDYSGYKERSFETTLTGIRVRLEDDIEKNLEWEPDTAPIDIDGEKFKVTVYAFKKDKGRTYRPADKGVIFTLNGQTQGWFSESFFKREKTVGMGYLKESLLIIVDCSNISFEAQEFLFQNSRDRLSTEPIRYKLESKLEDLIRNHPGLRALREQRRREKKAEKLEDNKVFENVLKNVLKNSKSLASFFSIGNRLSNPFKSEEVAGKKDDIQRKRYPEYFKFKKIPYKEVLKRNCHLESKVRITFETDAENKYFDRTIDRGSFEIIRMNGKESFPVHNTTLHLFQGIATLTLDLPELATVNSVFQYKTAVTDSTRIVDGPFINEFELTVLPALNKQPTTKSKRRRNPDDEKKGDHRDNPVGISIPQPTQVFKEAKDETTKSWTDFSQDFDEETSLFIEYAGEDDGDYAGYDFFINMDNIHLNNEIKAKPEDADTIMEQYKIGMVLLGMSMLHKDKESKKKSKSNNENSDKMSIDEKVNEFTKAIGPVLLPMINGLSELNMEEEE